MGNVLLKRLDIRYNNHGSQVNTFSQKCHSFLTSSNAIEAIAAAVYLPTPGSSFCSSSALLGISPLNSDEIYERAKELNDSIPLQEISKVRHFSS